MTLLDELRARRGDADDPFDQDAARREYKRQAGRRDRERNQHDREVYEQGQDDERKRAEERANKAKPNRRRPAQAKRRPPTRRRSSSARDLKRGAQSLASPMRAQISSGVQFLGLSLAVAALYLVLTSEEQTGTFSKALSGLQRGLRWLTDPTAAVPFGHDNTE